MKHFGARGLPKRERKKTRGNPETNCDGLNKKKKTAVKVIREAKQRADDDCKSWPSH